MAGQQQPSDPSDGEDTGATDVGDAREQSGMYRRVEGPRMPPNEQSFRWYARPIELLLECRARFGDPFALDLARFGRHVCFSHPDALKEIFTTHADSLEAGAGNAPLAGLLGKGSLLLLDGKPHRRHRRLLMPAFHGPRIAAYGRTIRDIADQRFRTWGVGPRALHGELLSISLEIILQTVFGLADDERRAAVSTLITGLLHGDNLSLRFFEDDAAEGNVDLEDTLDPLRQRGTQLDILLYDEIHRRRAAEDEPGSDVLSMLVGATAEDGSRLTVEEIHDELLTLLVAGHETTAAGLGWTLAYVARNPEVQARCHRELGLAPTAEQIGSNAYLRAVCQEALRAMPVIPVVSRRAREPIVVAGHAIEVGEHVMPCIYLTHHRSDIYGDPERFRPERFLERRFSPFEFLPFGGGQRVCIGNAFALYEMTVVLGTLLTRFAIAADSDELPQPRRSALLVHPSDGTRVVLSEVPASSRSQGQR